MSQASKCIFCKSRPQFLKELQWVLERVGVFFPCWVTSWTWIQIKQISFYFVILFYMLQIQRFLKPFVNKSLCGSFLSFWEIKSILRELFVHRVELTVSFVPFCAQYFFCSGLSCLSNATIVACTLHSLLCFPPNNVPFCFWITASFLSPTTVISVSLKLKQNNIVSNFKRSSGMKNKVSTKQRSAVEQRKPTTVMIKCKYSIDM